MVWFKNVTRIRKWVITTIAFVFGMYEEITESFSNYTETATNNINHIKKYRRF